ncbi:MAG: transcription elongation factor GreA [Bacteroidales bacterium]|nr:transcription elongation factor GreA [Bacteroidales bacterium]
MSKPSYITEEGLSKLKKELEQLIFVERPAISQQIAEARDKGDLSENAEYEAAKDAQAFLEMKIAKLEDVIANSRILDESRIDTSKVQIMNKVRIKNQNNNQTMEYTIVSSSEADVKRGRISVDTPIAKGLLGKKVGDVVNIQVPSGQMSFEIMDISL